MSEKTTNLDFGEALQALKNGKRVARSIWGGYWYLAKNVSADHDRIFIDHETNTDGFVTNQMIIAILRDDAGVTPAQPYQTDLLATDWKILE